MWSLPDITRLNAEAADSRHRAKLEKMARTGKDGRKKLECLYSDSSVRCSGHTYTELVYDIFSDDPKDVLTLCENHSGYYGSPAEGYFTCEDCQKTFIENYTWELYRHDTEDGTLCLPCYAARELAESANWIPLTDAAINSLTFEDVRKAKHLIAVKMPAPKGVAFKDNVEFDSVSGGRLTGFSSCEPTPDGGIRELQDVLRDLQEQGYKRAILILDAAYQFAVSIGVYVPDSVVQPVLQ